MTDEIELELNEDGVLKAMLVVPVAWLTAEAIIGEMGFRDGRQIAPILKTLLAKGLIQKAKGTPAEYCLSDEMEKKVLKEWGAKENWNDPAERWLGRRK